jgi:hypothetical protein
MGGIPVIWLPLSSSDHRERIEGVGGLKGRSHIWTRSCAPTVIGRDSIIGRTLQIAPSGIDPVLYWP